jgi:hypothetical protein
MHGCVASSSFVRGSSNDQRTRAIVRNTDVTRHRSVIHASSGGRRVASAARRHVARHLLAAVGLLSTALSLGGCFAITRTETDLYTVTIRDTTIREDAINPPGEREGGTIYPSPRSVEISRRYVQRDSAVNRYYPAYLRFGGIEAMSFLSPGTSEDGAGNGLFGLYDLLNLRDTSDRTVFGGSFYRLVPYELRLRWFDDAPDWTIGTSIAEGFVRKVDNRSSLQPGEYLLSVLNGYIRKRIFLREEPPYVMVVPFLGLSGFPSQYVNGGATIDVGSFGGFNLRGYAGYVHGTSSWFAGAGDTLDYSASFPYFGIGISALDFVNKTEELFIEWKDHDHNALEVSALNVDFVRSFGADDPFAGDTVAGSTPAISGVVVRLASATYPLPFANRRFFVGTSLLNVLALSGSELGYSFLPIRAGYRHNLLLDQLNVEPFIELNYYPTTVFQIGARTSLKISDWVQGELILAYASGSINDDVKQGLLNIADDLELQNNGDFSTVYLGIGLGIGDVFHTPEEVDRR